MFYRLETGPGLPRDPLDALVMPRPVGWISIVDMAGRRNLPPSARFTIVAYQPPHTR